MLAHTGDTQTQVRVNEKKVADVVAETRGSLEESAARTTELLTRLAAAMAAHSRADTSIGILEEIVTEAPRLAIDAQTLQGDHLELPLVLLDLRMRARNLQTDIDEALGRLAEHQRLAQHLVYEAFSTDLGEGD